MENTATNTAQIELSKTLAALDEIAGLMELIRGQTKDSDILSKFEDYYAKTVKKLEEYAVKIEKLIEDSENIDEYESEGYVSKILLVWKAVSGDEEAKTKIALNVLTFDDELYQEFNELAPKSFEPPNAPNFFTFVQPYQRHCVKPGSSIYVLSFVGCKSGEHFLDAPDCHCVLFLSLPIILLCIHRLLLRFQMEKNGRCLHGIQHPFEGLLG